MTTGWLCRFRVISVDGLLLAANLLNDNGGEVHETVALPESTTPDNSDVDLLPFHRTYIGLDSLRQIEIMDRRIITGGKRYLDCGTGAGALMLYFSHPSTRRWGLTLTRIPSVLPRSPRN